jgi:hypothetical protein
MSVDLSSNLSSPIRTMNVWQRRLAGVLALGGGYLGLWVALEQFFVAGDLLSKILCLPFLALYTWGTWCGLQIIEGADDSIRINSFFWALQVPLISSPVISYKFASGALLYVSVQPVDLTCSFDVRFGSQFALSLFQQQPWTVGVNVFALCVWLYLVRCMRTKAPDKGGAISPPRSTSK